MAAFHATATKSCLTANGPISAIQQGSGNGNNGAGKGPAAFSEMPSKAALPPSALGAEIFTISHGQALSPGLKHVMSFSEL